MNPTLTRLAVVAKKSTRPPTKGISVPLRKAHQFSSHLNLLTNSPVLLFLRPTDFTAKEWATLRSSLQKLAASLATPGATTDEIKLTFLRAGLLPALLKSPLLASSIDSTLISAQSSGALAVLTCPTLHPPTLLSLLALLNASSITPSANAPPHDPKSKLPPVIVERLGLLSSSLEGRAFDPAGTKAVGNLPGLDTLRAQILGLISAPSRNLVTLLGASGRQLARTLQGYEEGLKIKEEGEVKP